MSENVMLYHPVVDIESKMRQRFIQISEKAVRDAGSCSFCNVRTVKVIEVRGDGGATVRFCSGCLKALKDATR